MDIRVEVVSGCAIIQFPFPEGGEGSPGSFYGISALEETVPEGHLASFALPLARVLADRRGEAFLYGSRGERLSRLRIGAGPDTPLAVTLQSPHGRRAYSFDTVAPSLWNLAHSLADLERAHALRNDLTIVDLHFRDDILR